MAPHTSKGGYARVTLEDDDDPAAGLAEETAYWRGDHSWFRRLTMRWLTPLFHLGNRRQVNYEDLPGLSSGWIYWQQLHLAPMLAQTKEVLADQAVNHPKQSGVRGSLMWALVRVFWCAPPATPAPPASRLSAASLSTAGSPPPFPLAATALIAAWLMRCAVLLHAGATSSGRGSATPSCSSAT